MDKIGLKSSPRKRYIIKKSKRQTIEWEKRFVIQMSNKGFVSRTETSQYGNT